MSSAATIDAILTSHPVKDVAAGAIAAILAEAASCAVVCTICADACLAEDDAALLVECIRLNLDCAAVCTATANLAARAGAREPASLKAMLAACAAATRDCGDICAQHAMHEHCRICAEACRACEEAARAALHALQLP